MDHEPRFHGEVSEKSHNTMSKIKGKDTKPEIILRKYLWSKGLRYRKNYKALPGKPDIAIIERDKQKDKELQALGWTVIHFWSKEIEKDTEKCYQIILEHCN